MKLHLITLLSVIVFHQTVSAGPLPDAPHIVVTGEYELRATPDTLTLSLRISETGFEVAKARETVETRSKKLITSLKALGIAKKDIGSAQLQITPHYNWNNRAQIYAGTEVSRGVDVTLRDLNRYDNLIRSVVDAQVAQIQSTRLSSSKEKNLRQEALEGAIKNGLEKAQFTVKLLPQKIGPVYAISPQSRNTPFLQSQYRAAEMAQKSAFEPGTIIFRESIQIVFYLIKDN